MPWFALMGYDGARGLELRGVHRPSHLDYWRPLAAAGRVRHAGPLLDEQGQPRGSVLIFDAADLPAAKALAAADPYSTNRVFERHELFETRAVLPEA